MPIQFRTTFLLAVALSTQDLVAQVPAYQPSPRLAFRTEFAADTGVKGISGDSTGHSTLVADSSIRSTLQEEAEPVCDTSLESLRTAAGIYVGSGIIVEGISIATHTAIPYLGIGHFAQGDVLKGVLYMSAEVGLPLLERSLRRRVGQGNYIRYRSFSSPSYDSMADGLSPVAQATEEYADITRQTGFYVRMLDFYDAYRGFHAKTSRINKVHLGDESIPALMISPFKPHHLTNPWVFGPALLAAAVMLADAGNGKSLSSAQELSMFNSKFSPAGAAVTTSGIDAFRYMMVAGGEEMFFRGALQTELTERTTPSLALTASSILFGAWHLPNNSVLGALAATAAGLYLGYRYQANGYDLGEVIATHFWLDFLPGVIEFVQNPSKGRFVYSITWKI